MAKKPQDKPLTEMTDEERRAELERLQAEMAQVQARRQRLEDTGFYEWREKQKATLDYGDVWLAGYDKALFDEAEMNDPRE